MEKQKIPFDAYNGFESDCLGDQLPPLKTSAKLDFALDMAVVGCLVVIVMYVVFSLMLGLSII